MNARGRHTLHLAPLERWEAGAGSHVYTPEQFEREDFIHTTLGAENLADVANRYYRDDNRDFVALVIDVAKVGAPIRHDEDSGIYPHIYGPLERSAVVAVIPMARADDGRFLAPDIREVSD